MSEIFLVQISDLHFDKDIRNARHARFRGYDAHDVRLCHALVESLYDNQELPDMDRCHLLVGGDLTSTGIADEFAVASTFLRSEHVISDGGITNRLGLSHREDQYWSIPGNHDHWDGRWQFPKQPGCTKEIFPKFFRSHPWVQPIQSGELELVVCGIDSNSVFEDFWINVNPFASGGFSEVHRRAFKDAVDAAMSAALPDGVRRRTGMILCHHPFTTDCSAEPLRPTCSKWLLQLAADHGIPVILTGHTHRWWTENYPVTTTHGRRNVYEVRSPTTLQTEPHFEANAIRESSLRRPGFWLYRLVLGANLKVTWTLKLFLFSAGRFQWCRDDNWFSFTD